MPFCPTCADEHTVGQTFCAGCGGALAAPPVATQRTLPPPSSSPARSVLPTVDWRRIVAGNWLGSLVVAAVALGTSGLFSLVLVALAKPEDFGLDNALTLIAAGTTGAYGADLIAQARLMGESANAWIGIFPLTITIASLACALLAFRRVTARYTRWSDALGDAARAALIFAVGQLVIAIAFRSETRQFGRGWGQDVAGVFDARVAWGPDRVGAFFLGFLVLFTVLALACFLRRDWWPPQVHRVHDWLAAPLYGVGVFAALLPLAGLIGFLLLLTGDLADQDPTDDDLSAGIAMVITGLASGGFWLLTLGAGGALGAEGSEGRGPSDSESHHLKFFADDAPGLWAAPAVLIAVLLLTAFVVARRAPQDKVLGNLGAWVALVLVTTSLFVRLSSAHGRVEAADEYATGSAGSVGWQAVLLLTLAAAVCAVVVAALTGSLEPRRVLSGARAFAQRVQVNPASPATADPRAVEHADETTTRPSGS